MFTSWYLQAGRGELYKLPAAGASPVRVSSRWFPGAALGSGIHDLSANFPLRFQNLATIATLFDERGTEAEPVAT